MASYRLVALGTIVAVLLLGPPIVEFATGDAPFTAASIAIELFELLTTSATVFAIVFLVNEIREVHKDRESLVNDLTRSREEGLMWRENARNLVLGAREAIDRQFDLWQFTPAEKDIATLILKGCSHKEIADIRKSTATTVRQQAQSIYRKAGLDGRSELAAYFLDAILHTPDGEPPRAPELMK